MSEKVQRVGDLENDYFILDKVGSKGLRDTW